MKKIMMVVAALMMVAATSWAQAVPATFSYLFPGLVPSSPPSLGFNATSEVYLEDDIPHIDMMKEKD